MIKISGSLNNLCIDSKFPKESYDKMIKANTKEDKVKLSKSFKLDISNHVLDVKKKYIIPGETAEIALIFIPSEQIYVEVFNLFLLTSHDINLTNQFGFPIFEHNFEYTF